MIIVVSMNSKRILRVNVSDVGNHSRESNLYAGVTCHNYIIYPYGIVCSAAIDKNWKNACCIVVKLNIYTSTFNGHATRSDI